MTQWLSVFQLSEHDARTMSAAFVAVFPHTALLYGERMQWLLVGSAEPLQLPLRRTAARIKETTRRALRADGIADLADFHGGVLQTDAQLRAWTRAAEPLSDDRPTIQYPWEALGHYARYADRLRLRTDRWQAFGGPEPPKLAQDAAAHARAIAHVLRALRYAGSESIEHWEVTFGSGLQPALAERPGHEGLLELLGIDSERMTLALRALQRPSAPELLAMDRSRIGNARMLQARTALEQAAIDLARWHYYARDYATALGQLDRLAPAPGEAARVALLQAGALRALGRSAEAAAAFARAASRSRHAEFRCLALALARDAAKPFAPERGPLHVPNSDR
jgi:hypothetical protein